MYVKPASTFPLTGACSPARVWTHGRAFPLPACQSKAEALLGSINQNTLASKLPLTAQVDVTGIGTCLSLVPLPSPSKTLLMA
ncbi:hypothetical protein GY45DRAFT_1129867 [Cubamyces sp. BRFM 1775]|nr:hypothetical protein GY45DRAFT_1129867 [Cubamyces sp. BRFM 1775]